MKKVALLFYGQPRLVPDYTEPLNRLKSFFEDENIKIEIFIHTWKNSVNTYHRNIQTEYVIENNSDYIFDFINDFYQPKKILIEESRKFDKEYFHKDSLLVHIHDNSKKLTETEISNFISQIYSVSSVCKLIDEVDVNKFEYFILTRFDMFLVNLNKDNFNKLLKDTNNLSNCTIINSDQLQIFNKDTLNIYKDLLKLTKERVFKNGINPELLRFVNLFEKPNYKFYGNFYFHNTFFKGYNINCEMNGILTDCQIIRNKDNVTSVNPGPYFSLKPIWFQSNCGFLFFDKSDNNERNFNERNFKTCLIVKLKKHISHTQKFDLNQLNCVIFQIKFFNVWYGYNYIQSQKVIDDNSELVFEIKYKI